ncbi:hypothetical protein [Enterococcus sp. AZ103]|uniref:hypothetical protein n=1 Tax=Enterococcus sp. AZ103 TaxID=2774628 RepID=UPI003F1FFAA2
MIQLHLTTPMSKEYFEGIHLRKNVLEDKIDYFKEQKYLTVIATYHDQVIGSASIQRGLFSTSKIINIAVLPGKCETVIEEKLRNYAKEVIENQRKNKASLKQKAS